MSSLRGAPVEFTFTPPPSPENPFARELWANVITPSGRTLRLPAFYAGNDRFSVRARPEESGTYRLGPITETTGAQPAHAIEPARVNAKEIRQRGALARPSIRLDPKNPRAFSFSDGRPYVPIGANLPWPSNQRRVDYYRRGIPAFGAAGLNWMRIWMAHWSGLNLDWLPPKLSASPVPGTIDLRVAADWDRILALAESHGVYVQLVLQHHGQFSTTVNENWAEHPWNAAQPHGFLRNASEFFTNEQARVFTKRKYRAIVARYGWSPAIVAWELFNEVHWVDALKLDDNVEAVARWHDEMAAYLRSVDPYRHLVATSTDDLESPIYRAMDFYQPHLYPSNILAAIRTYDQPIDRFDRPVFYGEFGDDHQPLTAAEKKANHAIVPPVWASLMGVGSLPGQVWLGWNLLDTGRIGELGAAAKFIAATRIAEREGLLPFSAAVESTTRVPLRVTPSHVWQPRGDAEVAVPLDGRQPLEFANIPRMLYSLPDKGVQETPSRTTFRVDLPQPGRFTAIFRDGADRGATIRVSVDGAEVAAHTWPARAPAPDDPKRPVDVAFEVPAGEHRVTLENPTGGPVEFHALDLGRDTAALAAIGKRSSDFIAVWVWHRTEIFAVDPPAPVRGVVIVDDVPAGSWDVTWWDSMNGRPTRPHRIEHRGGPLRISTPRILRHAAVALEHAPAR